MPETVGEAESLYEQGKAEGTESVVFLGSDGSLHPFELISEQEESQFLEELL